ncbi:MAG: biotin attachment protein [Caldilineales bacterium]|nr:biotin attachment protein [Caldilineales bacterium]
MRRYTIAVNNQPFEIEVKELTTNQFRVVVDDRAFEVALVAEEDVPEAVIRPEILPLPAPAARPAPAPAAPLPLPQSASAGPAQVKAPMPGVIIAVDVAAGQRVHRGQQLLVLEAMKMKNPIRATHDTVVAQVLAQPGQSVNFDDLLLVFEE